MNGEKGFAMEVGPLKISSNKFEPYDIFSFDTLLV